MEGGIYVTTLIVLSLLFCIILYELLLAKGGCPRQNGGYFNRVVQTDKGPPTWGLSINTVFFVIRQLVYLINA